MASEYNEGIKSTASVAGHPLHPMLIPFPIAFLVGTFASDLVYWATADTFWARMSLWLVGAGLVTGALAAVLGLTDFLTINRARQQVGWIHFLGNAVALVVSLANVLLRAGNPVGAVLPVGIILSAITTGVLVITGWMGGELAYRYKIGVVGDENKTGTGMDQRGRDMQEDEERFRRAA